jgi:hypothetical protein
MTTPDQLADRARVDQWIASWNAKQILAYNKQVAERDEMHRKCEERERGKDDGFALPEKLKEWEAKYDFGEHMRRRFPVGAFHDAIGNGKPDSPPAPAFQLMNAAKTGQQLLCSAIALADDQDNAEFFIEAYENWGPLVDAVLEMCDREYRDSRTGRARASR